MQSAKKISFGKFLTTVQSAHMLSSGSDSAAQIALKVGTQNKLSTVHSGTTSATRQHATEKREKREAAASTLADGMRLLDSSSL